MSKIDTAEILKLTVTERIQLVEDVWDSMAAMPEAVPLTPAQKQELNPRLEEYHRNPRAGSPWGLVRERIRTSQ